MSAKPLEVFYLYAQEDEPLRNQLDKHLYSLQRQGLIKQWYDRNLSAGMEWEREINTRLATSQIILLLLSPDFMASDYCYSLGIQQALKQHNENKARVVPVLLRPVYWKGTPFEKLQALPTGAKPVTTWSNVDEALLDVTQGIRNVITDWFSSSASSPQIPLYFWTVPYRRNPFFTGREEIIEGLHKAFRGEHSLVALSKPQALTGLSGIGKTQIAIEYAYRYREEYSSIFWVDATSTTTLISSFVSIAEMLRLPEEDEQEQNIIIEAVLRWLRTHGGWLLIFDGADDRDCFLPFIPSAGPGHILLTSQLHAHGEIIQTFSVEVMPLEVGTHFLLRRARLLGLEVPLESSINDKIHLEARAIVEELGGLPLAIDQAAAYILETACSLSTYLTLYHTRADALLGRRGLSTEGHPETVATTWALIFEQVKKENPYAIKVLNFCAFLYPDAIPEEFFFKLPTLFGIQSTTSNTARTGYHPLIKFDMLCGILLRYSLINRNEGGLHIHRLVQVVLKAHMNKRVQRQWAERATLVVSETFPSVGFTTWQLCQQYLPHVQVCKTYIEQWRLVSPYAAKLLGRAGYYLWDRAQYEEAEPFYHQALIIREHTLDAHHPDIASSLNNLARIYHILGKYSEAEALYQRAITIWKQLPGPEHPAALSTLENYADLLRKTGQDKQLSELEMHIQTIKLAREDLLQ